MLKIEKTKVNGINVAIRGMRNPLESWDKSDSGFHGGNNYDIGSSDRALMRKLVLAGTDHAKFMRMITVSCDIIAPQYFVAELDTYKIGTTRNSCSLQHKGASRPFSILDFSVDERLYEILSPQKVKVDHSLVYPECGENDYRLYQVADRKYKIFKNGRVVSCEYERQHETDNRKRHFREKEVTPSQTPYGYYELNLGGRIHRERWFLHRLVAEVWLKDSYFDGAEINHKDGCKGNNCSENLEWVTHAQNEIHKHANGLSGRTLHTDYIAWKNSSKTTKDVRRNIINEYQNGALQKTIAEKYGISQQQVSEIIRGCGCDNKVLFETAETWEMIISAINDAREMFLETGDYNYFIAMRQMIPMGYNYRFTWQANYAVLRNIYFARRNHKLTEWHTFCDWIRGLPLADIITAERSEKK